MSDDEARLWLFAIFYILYIIYLRYVENLSIVKKDWEDLKCNPLYLLTDSLISTSEQSNLNFQSCIKKTQNIPFCKEPTQIIQPITNNTNTTTVNNIQPDITTCTNIINEEVKNGNDICKNIIQNNENITNNIKKDSSLDNILQYFLDIIKNII
jgi:hypothetical protein